MKTEAPAAAREVETFEEYTLYSLERSTPTLLNMMERSKRIAGLWPDVVALMEAAGLCQEIAALAGFQDTLGDLLGLAEGKDPVSEQWQRMRRELSVAMDTMEDVLTLQESSPIKRLFSVELPEALNQCIDVIPAVTRHLREQFMTEGAGSEAMAAGGDG